MTAPGTGGPAEDAQIVADTLERHTLVIDGPPLDGYRCPCGAREGAPSPEAADLAARMHLAREVLSARSAAGVPGDGGEALRREVEAVVCPKCKAAPGEPCITGGYLPVGDLDGDVRPEGPHRQRRAAAAAVRERREDDGEVREP